MTTDNIDKAFINGYKCAIKDVRKALTEDNRILNALKERDNDATKTALCDMQITENEKKLKYLRELEEIADNHFTKEDVQ